MAEHFDHFDHRYIPSPPGLRAIFALFSASGGGGSGLANTPRDPVALQIMTGFVVDKPIGAVPST